MATHRPDILIIGAGILGSSVAWHLAQKGAGSIMVIDLDLAGTYSSSELNAGGIRATWWNPVNIAFAWESLKFYETIAKEVQFFQKGYLFLYPPSKWQVTLKKRTLYEQHQIPIQYLEAGEIGKLIPEFKNLKGIAGATFSPKDGLIDPHLLRDYYRNSAKTLGVEFLDRFYVKGMDASDGKINSVHILHGDQANLPEDQLETILTQHRIPDPRHWIREDFQPKQVINCTGAWLPITGQAYQRPAPVQALRRQLVLFSSHEEDFSDRGMIVDSSGLYFHPEGSHSSLILAGYSNRDEPPGYRFHYDGEKFFDRKIWLRLYRRGGREHFSALKHVRGWAGLYAVPPDNTGILWRVAGFENLFELGAATGRGVMQSYALGRAMAELVLQGRFESLDGSPLSGERFQSGELQEEKLDI